MERKTAVKTLDVFLTAVLMSAMLAGSTGAEIISPTAAVASTKFADVVGPGHLIDPTRLNASNQHVARRWGGNWLASDARNTDENWVYIDLGASYDLDEIRIWNYHEEEKAGIPELKGRGVKACSIWVALEDAALPTTGTPTGQSSAGFTTAKGWTVVWAGELNAGPSTVPPVADIGPTNVFDVTGQTCIRYVGIDIRSRWGRDPYTKNAPGLSYIQVTGRSLIATDPVPANAEQAAEIDQVLSWTKPSSYSPSGYEVYLGTDRHKIASRDDSARITASDADEDVTNTQCTLATALANGREYFWRVDSIVDGKAIPGPTWSFRTKLQTNNLGFDELVFVKRKPYSSDHNYSVVNNGTSADRFLAENGIYVYNLRT